VGRTVTDIDVGPFKIGPDCPVDPTSRRRRIRWYRAVVSSVLLIITLISGWAAINWPIHDNQIQTSFFLSLVGTSLTLFGLVFTLSLIGTQLIATRTNVTFMRTFGALTWPYFVLFLLTALWTLAISYYAGGVKASPVWFKIFDQRVTQVLAGRLSIFGLTWSLLLLLPFVIYIYWRLRQRYIFSNLVNSALRARNEETLRRRCGKVREEIISVASDPRALEEGLRQLLELAVDGAQRKNPKGSTTAEDIAECANWQFIQLTRQLVQEPVASGKVIKASQAWTHWLIQEVQQGHSVSAQKVGTLIRRFVKSATANLRQWETASSADVYVRESVRLVQEIVESCSNGHARLRVRISEPAIQLANCAAIKLVEGPRADFNLAFRSLIRICQLTTREDTFSLGGGVAVRETTRVIKSLGEAEANRIQLSTWILDELHDLADALSLSPSLSASSRDNFLGAIGLLSGNEIRRILRGPGLPKEHHQKREVCNSWATVVINRLYETGRWDEMVKSQASVVRRCADDSDLLGLVAILEQLEVEYVNNSSLQIQPSIITAVENIRTGFSRQAKLQKALTSEARSGSG
jgi:hypothetical protein